MDEFNGSDMRELEITSEGFHIHLSKNEVSFEKPAIAKASSEKPAIEAVEDVSVSEKSKASESRPRWSGRFILNQNRTKIRT